MPLFGPGFPDRGPGRSDQWPETGPKIHNLTPNSDRVAGGATVTITGVRFTSDPSGLTPLGGSTWIRVFFGSVEAAPSSVIFNGSFDFSVVVPPAAGLEPGTFDVRVIFGTQEDTLVDAFTYYTSEITRIVPQFGPLAGGTPVVIEGFNFITGSTITFGGSPATSVVFIDSEHIACVTPSHAIGFVDVVITEPSAATSTLRNGFKYNLLIRGEDFRRLPGVTIKDVLNNTPNSMSFSIDGNSQEPVSGELIEMIDVHDGNRLLFRGTIQTIDQEYEGLTDQLVWRCTAVDAIWLLNRRRPVGKYTNVSASSIVIDLINKFSQGFTVNHVQTLLAPISVELDGTQDFSSALNLIASGIGSGHWYVDYDNDLHFFHVPPPDINPVVPTTSGPGTPITLTEDGAIGGMASFATGYYYVRSTFLYSNGVESRLGPVSAIVAMNGLNFMQMDVIPLGSDPGGGITCTGRRIYFGRGTFPMLRGWKINDNTTTSITVYPGFPVPAVPPITYEGSQGAIISLPDVPPTPGAIAAPTVGIVIYDGPLLSGTNPPPPGAQTGSDGNWVFQAAAVYQDGNESLPSPFSNSVRLGSTPLSGGPGISLTLNFPTFLTLPTFPVINGVSPAFYKIYAKKLPSTGGIQVGDPAEFIPHFWCNMPYGTTGEPEVTEIDYGDRPRFTGDTPSLVWPNPDGPYLEDADPPGDLTDTNPDLLRNPQLAVSIDRSQQRNRVTVLGAGTVTTADAVTGESQLSVADVSIFTEAGGEIIVNGNVLVYFAPGTGQAGPGDIFLTQVINEPIAAGSAIRFYLQVDDLASQAAIGAIELDSNGNPTDGVHETIISDSSLILPQQLYMRANAELELFSRPIVTIRYATRDPKTKSGQRVTANMTDPPCIGDFLIQDVTIDQIHDESDQLRPRYTVVASSVKFELNDLLMQIVEGTLGGGGASVSTGMVGIGGIGGTGGGAVFTGSDHPQGIIEAPVGSTFIRSNGYRYYKQGGGTTRFGWYPDMDYIKGLGLGPSIHGFVNSEVVSITTTGGAIGTTAWANTNPGTPVYVDVNGRVYRRFNTNTTINTNSFINHGSAWAFDLWDADFDIVGRIAVADVSSIRIFLAISTAAITAQPNIVTNATPSWHTAIGYRSDQGEGSWIGMTKNDANNLSSTSGLATAVGGGTTNPTEVTLRIRWRIERPGISQRTAYFSVNDGEEIAQTTNVPTTNPSNPTIYFGGTNLIGADRTFHHRAILMALGD